MWGSGKIGEMTERQIDRSQKKRKKEDIVHRRKEQEKSQKSKRRRELEEIRRKKIRSYCTMYAEGETASGPRTRRRDETGGRKEDKRKRGRSGKLEKECKKLLAE